MCVGTGGPAAISKVAAGGLAKKLAVEGGVAAKARALYAALFTADAPAADADSNERPQSPGSPKQNGDSNGNSSSPKLAPSIAAAQELLAQLAHDAPGQLAQLVALEWLLTVSKGHMVLWHNVDLFRQQCSRRYAAVVPGAHVSSRGCVY